MKIPGLHLAYERRRQAKTEGRMARLLPGRVRIAATVYDADSGRQFVSLPAFAVTVDVKDARAMRRLWARVEAVLQDE